MTIVLIVCATSVFAQVRLGARGGISLAGMSSSEISDDLKMIPTVQLGGTAEFNLVRNFALQTGINLSGRGFKAKADPNNIIISAFYLQIPLQFIYKGKGFYLGAGSYAGLGLFGKFKDKFNGQTTTVDLKFGNNAILAPMDYGLSAEAGVSINESLRIGLGYHHGLANVIPRDNREGESSMFYTLTLVATYLIGE